VKRLKETTKKFTYPLRFSFAGGNGMDTEVTVGPAWIIEVVDDTEQTHYWNDEARTVELRIACERKVNQWRVNRGDLAFVALFIFSAFAMAAAIFLT
jgi:hypothetical protein